MALILSGDTDLATQAELDAIESQLLGVNQTWQDMTSSRASSTDYTNDTGKPIVVVINGNHTTSTPFLVDGVQTFSLLDGAGVSATGTAVVPNGSTYRLNGTTFFGWVELR